MFFQVPETAVKKAPIRNRSRNLGEGIDLGNEFLDASVIKVRTARSLLAISIQLRSLF